MILMYLSAEIQFLIFERVTLELNASQTMKNEYLN